MTETSEPRPCPWCITEMKPKREDKHTCCMNFRCHFYKGWVPDEVWDHQPGVDAAVADAVTSELEKWANANARAVRDAKADAVKDERERCCQDVQDSRFVFTTQATGRFGGSAPTPTIHVSRALAAIRKGGAS